MKNKCICSIANIIIEFENPSDSIKNRLKPFYSPDSSAELTFCVPEKASSSTKPLDKAHLDFFKKNSDMISMFRCFDNLLPRFDTITLHAGLVSIDNKGIIFAAESGTGKTTHMLLWKKLFAERLDVINGDKPFIRIEDGIVFGYNSPWTSSEWISTKEKTVVTDVCFIVRSQNNEIVPISHGEGVGFLHNQIHFPQDKDLKAHVDNLIVEIAKHVNFWIIKCNMDISAAQIAYDNIFKGDSCI